MDNDLELLRRFEPVLRFSGGKQEERFYPIRVEDYLEKCSLWRKGKRSGLLEWLRPLKVIEGWKNVPNASLGIARIKALGNFTEKDSYNYFLSFSPDKPKDNERVVRLMIGASALVLFLLILACAWGSIATGRAGNVWLSRFLWILVILGGGSVLIGGLMAFGISPENFSKGSAQVLTLFLGSILLVIAPLVFGWWQACVFLLAIELLIGISQGEQLIAFALALISPIRKQEAYLTHITCKNMSPVYYGRVCRDDYQIILQYFFFYALNDWRHHDGFNNHQGDWEGVFVFLTDEKDKEPTHIGFSQHHLGEVFDKSAVEYETINGQKHPVIFVAAGSHANYHKKGETLLEDIVASGKTGWGYKIARFIRKQREHLGQTELELAENANVMRKRMVGEQEISEPISPSELIVAMEHHEGSGRIIGPPGFETEQEFVEWPEPVVLKEDNLPGWANYRGLWGYKTIHKDESGPPGPQWNRYEEIEEKGERRVYWEKPLEWRKRLLKNPQLQ